MFRWLLLMTLLAGSAAGRSEKTTPFCTKAWWARELEEMKMAGRERIRTVKIGPYLACKFRRMGSSSEKDVPSQRRFPMRGKAAGPGGRLIFGKKKSWRDLRREAIQRETMKRKTHIKKKTHIKRKTRINWKTRVKRKTHISISC